MPPFLTDEHIERWEDPADRKPRPKERSVAYEHQVMGRHSWEDSKRRTLEKHALAILERINAPGVQRVERDEFTKLCDFVFWERDRDRRRAMREGKIDLGRTVVLRLEEDDPNREAA